MNDRLDTPVTANREQRRAAARGKKAAALGSGMVLATAGAGMAATLVSSAPAGAATFEVTTTADSGAGSLRQAIIDANGAAGQDTITFQTGLTGTITLASDLPKVTDALHIVGPGAAALTVDGADSFSLLNFYQIDSSAGSDSVSGLTLTRGIANNFDGSGGAIVVKSGSADMTITDAVITDNYAENDGGGVQFYDNDGTMVISGTTISNNEAFDAGGGLYADGLNSLNITITNSVITGNTAGGGGGGAYLDDSDVSITNSTINFNTSDSAGGGLYESNGTLTMTGSWVGDNTSVDHGGGLYLYDTNTTIDFSTITGNESTGDGGGGIFLYDEGTGTTATIRNSTISNNTAHYYGGGLYLDITGETTIENSTISGNTASQAGGVYGNYAGLVLRQVTITNNQAIAPDNGIAVGGVQMHGVFVQAPLQARRAARVEAKNSGKGKTANEAAKDEAKSARAGGVRAQATGELDAIGTIISANGGQDVGMPNVELILNSDHSLIGVIDPGVAVNDVGGSLLGVTDPGLEPLGNNGGPTQTHALAVGSPAKDTGPSPLVPFTGSEFDQRGTGFARVVDGTVDIGAFEAQAPLPVDIAPKFTG